MIILKNIQDNLQIFQCGFMYLLFFFFLRFTTLKPVPGRGQTRKPTLAWEGCASTVSSCTSPGCPAVWQMARRSVVQPCPQRDWTGNTSTRKPKRINLHRGKARPEKSMNVEGTQTWVRIPALPLSTFVDFYSNPNESISYSFIKCLLCTEPYVSIMAITKPHESEKYRTILVF